MRLPPFRRRDDSASSGSSVPALADDVVSEGGPTYGGPSYGGPSYGGPGYAGSGVAVQAPPAAPEVPPRPRFELWPKRVGAKDLMQFSRQLAAFVRAGIPILDGLALLEEDTENPTLKRAIHAIADALRAGAPLSEALDGFPKVFPVAYRSMLRSAELTGQLDVVLDRVSHYLERDVEARSKIRSALVYPAVIVVMSIGVVALLTTFVLPKFSVFFKSFHQKMPLPTRMLLGMAAFVEHWWYALFAAAAFVVAAAVWWVRTPRGRATVDQIALRLPAIGVTLRYALVERFCRVLGSMLQAGVAIPEAIEVAGTAMNNVHIKRALDGARDAMMRGEGIAIPLGRTGLFPPAATQMLRVGEDTGQLDAQLEAAGQFYERELDYKIKKLTSLFEPAVLVFMGLIVGFVAIALVSAMYGVFQHSQVH